MPENINEARWEKISLQDELSNRNDAAFGFLMNYNYSASRDDPLPAGLDKRICGVTFLYIMYRIVS